MKDCLFCMISSKKINTDIVFEDKKILAFRDISPQAPVHILLIPKIHISTLDDLKPKDVEITGHLVYNAAKLARIENIAHNGYRTVFNCNEWGGQTVYHLHLHLLGNRKFKWPPG